MGPDGDLAFAPYRLDRVNQQLWRDEAIVPVRPKLFAVLRYMIENAGRLITREELLRAVWGRVHVDETLLRGTMRDIRALLDDDADAPKYIETVPHRGYRFLAQVTVTRASAPDSQRDALPSGAIPLVERDAQVSQLRAWLRGAVEGRRKLIFVTGEAGIGKSSLIDHFASMAAQTEGAMVGRGQCVEQYGAGEAYLPVLEALTRLCRGRQGKKVLAILNQYAPTWLVQMPSLLNDVELQNLQRKAQGAGRERMLREMADALEALAIETPVTLLLEDLHWSDHSTLDLIGLLARRRESARLMIVGTYRPAEAIVSGHPLRALKQDLHAHGQCEELALNFLSPRAVEGFLARRFHLDPAHPELPALARGVHQRSDGNPLFMVNITDYLVAQGALVQRAAQWHITPFAQQLESSVPDGLRQLIERQLERLNEEDQRLLEVASVAGVQFTAASAAAGLETSLDDVEERCDALVQRNQFLDDLGAQSLTVDGVISHYRFRHALYQHALYDRLPAARRARLHRRIGEYEENSLGQRAAEHAAQLAAHFELAHDLDRALRHMKQAAKNALRRNAFQEAIALVERALSLLQQQPASEQQAAQELELRMLLNTPLVMTKGYAATEVAQGMARARELSQQLTESPAMLPALIGMTRFYFVRAELDEAALLGERCVRLGQEHAEPLLIATALMGCIRYSQGEMALARQYTQQCLTIYDRKKHGAIAIHFGDDPAVMAMTFDAVILWATGYPDQARKQIGAALAHAEALGIPYAKAFTLVMATWLHLYLGDLPRAQAHLEDMVQLSTAHGFQFLLAQSLGLRGWLLLQSNQDIAAAIALIERGLGAQVSTGVAIGTPRLLTSLAEALARDGQLERALSVVGEAQAHGSNAEQRFDQMQILRVKGELLYRQILEGAPPKTRGAAKKHPLETPCEAAFEESIALCQKRGAKSLELRATMSLSRLLDKLGRQREAHARLTGIVGWFTEGLDDPLYLQAKDQIARLASSIQ